MHHGRVVVETADEHHRRDGVEQANRRVHVDAGAIVLQTVISPSAVRDAGRDTGNAD